MDVFEICDKFDGSKLRMLRVKAGLTLKHVAALVPATPERIRAIESGTTQPQIRTAVRLCQIFGCIPSDMLGSKLKVDLNLQDPLSVKLIATYSRLTPEQKEDVFKHACFLAFSSISRSY